MKHFDKSSTNLEQIVASSVAVSKAEGKKWVSWFVRNQLYVDYTGHGSSPQSSKTDVYKKSLDSLHQGMA